MTGLFCDLSRHGGRAFGGSGVRLGSLVVAGDRPGGGTGGALAGGALTGGVLTGARAVDVDVGSCLR